MSRLVSMLLLILQIHFLVSCDTKQKVSVFGAEPLPSIALVEDHSEALARWARMGIKNAVVINIDRHDDIRIRPETKITEASRLYAAGDWKAFEGMERRGDDSLYEVGSFLYAAARLGIVREVYWVIPFTHFRQPDSQDRLRRMLAVYGFAEKDIASFGMKGGCFRGTANGMSFSVCGMDSLPEIDDPVLLSIDADFFPAMFVEYGINSLDGLKWLFDSLKGEKYRVTDAVVSYSVNGAYLPITMRWIADETAEIMGKPQMMHGVPPPAWIARQNAMDMLAGGQAGLLIPYLKGVLNNTGNEPSILLYLALAYVRLGDLNNAYEYALRSCMTDRRYCSGLAHIGAELAKDGNISDGMRFFTKGYELHPDMMYRIEDIAVALHSTGRYDDALSYFMKYAVWKSSYPSGFVIGELYLRKGDHDNARRWFDRAAAYLADYPYSVARMKLTDEAIRTAARFYDKRGDSAKASALRNDPRHKGIFASDDTHTL